MQSHKRLKRKNAPAPVAIIKIKMNTAKEEEEKINKLCRSELFFPGSDWTVSLTKKKCWVTLTHTPWNLCSKKAADGRRNDFVIGSVMEALKKGKKDWSFKVLKGFVSFDEICRMVNGIGKCHSLDRMFIVWKQQQQQ